MTFRTRTVAKPRRRQTRQSESRRNLYTTLAFGFAVVAAVAILGGVLIGNWYSDHWATMASVNGQSASKDDIRARHDVLAAKYNRQIELYKTLENQGKITATDFATLQNGIQQTMGTVTGSEDPTALYQAAQNEIVQQMEMSQYASQHGISVTDQQVNDQMTKDATIPEMRHILVIGVKPVPTPPASAPTDAEIQAAQTQAQKYLDDIKGGKKWEDVAKTTDTGLPSVGDLSLGTKDSFSLDPNILDAAFSLQKVNDLTPVLKGADGIYRFATVTEIVPAFTDPDWQTSIGRNASLDAYRSEARGEATVEAVKASVIKQYVQTPTKQRHVLELGVYSGYGSTPTEPEVKTKLIVVAPGNDTSSATTLPETDPKWAEAKTKADADFAKIKADPTQFDTIARSADNSEPYFKTSGGDVLWLPLSVYSNDGSQSAGLNLAAVATELGKPDLKPGQLVGPVKTAIGYAIVLYQGQRPAPQQRIAAAQLLISAGTDFATEAKQISEAGDAASGGDMGWVPRYLMSQDIEDAIFNTPVGSVSNLVTTNQGYFIFKVLEEQTRLPDPDVAERLRKSIFDTWLSTETPKYNVVFDPAGVSALVPSASSTP